MDDKSLGKLEETLALSKFAPKPKDGPSIDEVLDTIHADYAKLGDNIKLLEKRLRDSSDLLNVASETLLNIIRTQHK